MLAPRLRKNAIWQEENRIQRSKEAVDILELYGRVACGLEPNTQFL